MDTKIAQVKVWFSTDKKECRIYVRHIDGREGCKFLTGNLWNAKGSYTGALTAEEWQDAKSIAVVDGKWTTRYESELHGTRNCKPLPQNNRPTRCPDCGSYDCGPNCNANRW